MAQEDSRIGHAAADEEIVYEPGKHPDLPPPPGTIGVVGWLRQNLFSSIPNALLTLLAAYLLWLVIPPVLNWAIFDANFGAESKAECTAPGACWAVVEARILQFLYGFYDRELLWRPNLAGLLLLVALAPLLFDKVPLRRPWMLFSLAYPIVAYLLLYGGVGLETVATDKWGGLLVTVVSGVTGIGVSLPIGILLALGRRSHMPIVRSLCVGFIELVRGVPLITVLFMSSVMLPLFLPEGVNFDKFLRALIGVSLFASAYMAEVVRGGLQAIPKGQYEAASALGLAYWKSMYLIVLPQALRIVIPGIVNTFIGLFKDTTLLLIVGIFDLLGIARAAVSDASWLGLHREAYVFVALLFFIFCFGMSRYSIYLEKRLHTGHER